MTTAYNDLKKAVFEALDEVHNSDDSPMVSVDAAFYLADHDVEVRRKVNALLRDLADEWRLQKVKSPVAHHPV